MKMNIGVYIVFDALITGSQIDDSGKRSSPLKLLGCCVIATASLFFCQNITLIFVIMETFSQKEFCDQFCIDVRPTALNINQT